MPQKEQSEVVICGAGPIGMTLALGPRGTWYPQYASGADRRAGRNAQTGSGQHPHDGDFPQVGPCWPCAGHNIPAGF